MSRRKQLNPKPLKTDILTDLKNQSQNSLEQSYSKHTTTNGDKDELESPAICKYIKQEQDKQNAQEKSTDFLSEFQIKAIQNFKNEVQALFFKNNPSKYSSQLLENVSSSTPQTISDKRLDNKSTPIKNSDNTFDDNHQETHLLTEQGNSLTPIIKQSDQIQAEEDNENSSIEKIAKSNTTVTNSILINGKRYYPLRFSCENCGLRYSDQSTLMIHKKNYCSKRHCTKSPRSSSNTSKSSSSSRSPSISSRSSSRSPNRSSTSDGTNNNDSNLSKEQTNISLSHKKSNQNEAIDSKAHENGFESSYFSDIESREENKAVQLVKSVIYQCNSCLFQTDKKSVMNRHSRVHLAQKRKSMEDLLENNNSDLSSNESGSSKIPKLDNHQEDKVHTEKLANESKLLTISNHKKQSYCTDCDIQFSSVSTYQHHRNNYCQKYKTIEAILPLDKANGNGQEKIVSVNNGAQLHLEKLMKKTGFKSEPIIKKSQTFDNLQEPLYPALDQSSDYHLALAKVLSENKSSHISKSELLGPLGPVQMGDMVYLPAYKVLDHQQQVLNKNKLIEHENTVLKQYLQNNTKLMHQMSLLQAHQNNEDVIIADKTETANLKHYQNLIRPLTLRDRSSAICNNPLDLSNKPAKTTVQQHGSTEASKEYIKQQQLLLANQVHNQNYNPISLNRFSHLNPCFPTFNPNLILNQNSHLANVSHLNKLVSPLLLNSQRLSLLDQIAALQGQKPEPSIQNRIYQCNLCHQMFFDLKVFESHACTFKDEKRNQVNLRTVTPSKNLEQLTQHKYNQTPTSHIDEGLLKHPLVMKTIKENYGNLEKFNENITPSGTVNNSNEYHSKNFFVCTTCGYRGNTIRGVKQHGKLHLAQSEQFAVINISSEFNEPILVYNSNNDVEFQLAHISPSSSKSIEIDEQTEENYSDEMSIEVSSNKNNELEEVKANSCIIKKEMFSPTSVPFSKKARILDLHYNQQKSLTTALESVDSMKVKAQGTDVEKSQTFCFKCNIQFQQISNFLAHKKLYCN